MADKAPSTVKELAKMLQDLTTKFGKLDTDVQEVKKSITFVSDSFDAFKTTLESVRTDVQSLRKDHESLKTENNELKKELAAAKADIIELKQYSRQNNVEIKGMPFDPKERLEDAVQTLGTKLNIELHNSEIDVVHRVPSKDKEKPNIVVRFVSRSSRSKVLEAARKKRLTAINFGFTEDTSIYINEHLCVEKKVLLGKTIHLRKERGWKFSWVKEGKILVRKTENSPVIHIARETDLVKIV